MEPGKPKLLKLNNRKHALALFRNSKQLSAADLSEKLMISKTTVMKIIDYFQKEGVISSSGKGASSAEGGKPPELFRFNGKYAYAIGVHVFPESVLSVIVDLHGNIEHSIRTPLKKDESIIEVINTISASCHQLLKANNIDHRRLAGIGIGIPGIVDAKKGVIRMSPWFPSWPFDTKFNERLLEALGLNVPVFIDNECRFQAFAEKIKGVAQTRENIIAIKAGEGLAAGIIVNGEIKRGTHHLSGEIGHMIINPHDTKRCVCGSRGCFEACVYESRLIEEAIEARDEYPDSRIFKDFADGVTAEAIFESAGTGDPLARICLDNMIKWFAIALSNLIVVNDPEIIVIQGIYAKAGEYFIDSLTQRVNRLVLSKIQKDVEIRYSELGPEIGALGASLFVISEYFKQEPQDKQRMKMDG